MNYSSQQQNGSKNLDSISNQQLGSQSQLITIKKKIEPTELTSQIQSSSYEHTQIQSQPQKFAHIKHIQFDDENECVDVGIEVKDEDVDDDDQVDEKSSRHVKRPKLDTTQPNNAIHFMEQVDGEHQNGGQTIEDGHGQAMNTQFELHSQSTDTVNSNLMVIQQEERDTNNAVGEESIATECTTNPIQANLAQSNRHLQCSHCNKSFDRNSKLKAHLRVHTGERPFQCNQCDKHFTQKGHLESHLRTHSGERPHQCRFCEKSFTQLNVRNAHEQATHQHVKPFRCKLCGHTATQRSSVITHVRMVHFGLPKSIKQQRALNIVDYRNTKELIEKV